MKNRGQMVILVLVMVAALLLCVGLHQKRLDRQHAMEEVDRLSQESNAAWNATNDAKLVLQEQNQILTEEIREAELQLTESTQKISDIEAQLGELQTEKAGLEERLTAANERKSKADAARIPAEQKAVALEEAIRALHAAAEVGDLNAASEAEEKITQLLAEE